MNRIEEISLIQFQERKYNHQGDHILFVYSDGCASSIGRIGGAQVLHLNEICVQQQNRPQHVIIHEVKIFSRVNGEKFVKSFTQLCNNLYLYNLYF